MENFEDRVGVGAGVRQDFGWLQLGLLLQNDLEKREAVTQCAGHGNIVEPGEPVGDQVVERPAVLLAVVARVRH